MWKSIIEVVIAYVVLAGFIGLPAMAQNESTLEQTPQEIEALINELSSDEFEVRKDAQKKLAVMKQKAFQPVLDAMLDSTREPSVNALCGDVMEEWCRKVDGEAAVVLFEMLHSGAEAATNDDLRRLRNTRQLLQEVQSWISDGNKLRVDRGRVRITDWQYSERQSKLIALLPGITHIYASCDIPAQFFVDQKDTSIEELVWDSPHVSMENDELMQPREMDAETMAAVLQIKNICVLEFRNTVLAEDAIPLLAKSDKILDLDFRLTRPADLVEISKMRQLETIGFYGALTGNPVAVTAEDLKPLTKMSKLREMRLGFCRLESGAGDVLKDIPSLTSVSLHFPDDETLAAVLENEKVVELSVLPAFTTSDQVAEAIANASHLEVVHITGMSLTDVGLQSLIEMDSLNRLMVGGGFFSSGMSNKAEEKLGRMAFTTMSFDRSIMSAADSQAIHEFAKKGLLPYSFPRQPQFYIFQEHWKGTNEDFVEIIKSGFWKSLQTDLPLNDELVKAMLEELELGDNKNIVVYDSGQHADGMIEKLKESCETKTMPRWKQLALPEQGEGDCWLFK